MLANIIRKKTALPAAFVALFAFAIVFYATNRAPATKAPSFAAASLQKGVTTIPVARDPNPSSGSDHHSEHDVLGSPANIKLAQTSVFRLGQAKTGGPWKDGDNIICMALKLGNAAIRFYVWSFDYSNPVSGVARGTMLIWKALYDQGENPWITVFVDQNKASALNVPSNLRSDNRYSMNQINCNDMPPPPALPMATP